jgi:putative alpha-1,2-mannosidase
LIAAMGGRDAAAKRLDGFFAKLNAGPASDHAYLGNEPTLGTPWLYAWLGQPYKTQRIVREALRTLYSATPGGYPGNDDLGTMSAWYVLASVGLYPAIPGSDTLLVSSPSFRRARLRLAKGILDIRAPGASERNLYVHKLALRGRPVRRTWLRWNDVARGGTLRFRLASAPDKAWGALSSDAPPSVTPARTGGH